MTEVTTSQSTQPTAQIKMTGKQQIFTALLIIIGVYFVWYFSPEATCRRQAKLNVYKKAAVADFNIGGTYKEILDGMIDEETKKCLEER